MLSARQSEVAGYDPLEGIVYLCDETGRVGRECAWRKRGLNVGHRTRRMRKDGGGLEKGVEMSLVCRLRHAHGVRHPVLRFT